jgi:endonuclease YncB( thermonuclease family)
LNKIIKLKNIQPEKYGRILADVYINELHLNAHLLKKRLAVSYDGGTKISPKNWMDYYSKGELEE